MNEPIHGLGDFEIGVLADFIDENWQMFTDFAEQQGIDETTCEQISALLTMAAGRG